MLKQDEKLQELELLELPALLSGMGFTVAQLSSTSDEEALCCHLTKKETSLTALRPPSETSDVLKKLEASELNCPSTVSTQPSC